MLRQGKNLVQGGGDEFYSRLHPLARVASRMEVVVVAGNQLHAGQVVLHHGAGKLPQAGISGAQVHGVGSVGHQPGKAPVTAQVHQGRRIRWVRRLGSAATRIPGEKGKGIRTDGQGHVPHGGKAL